MEQPIVTTVYGSLLNDFNEQIEREEKKYPLSDREKLFVKTIQDLLENLNYEHCSRYSNR
jgi:hypothetical protein